MVHLCDVDPRGLADLWRWLCELTKGRPTQASCSHILADNFNVHYVATSTDGGYKAGPITPNYLKSFIWSKLFCTYSKLAHLYQTEAAPVPILNWLSFSTYSQMAQFLHSLQTGSALTLNSNWSSSHTSSKLIQLQTGPAPALVFVAWLKTCYCFNWVIQNVLSYFLGYTKPAILFNWVIQNVLLLSGVMQNFLFLITIYSKNTKWVRFLQLSSGL